ncbi:MAG: hypothetical protein U5L96_03185 [Owenweeksia sp.]|nr:hypothetical protein [Owenweeksia sp.]
MSGTQAMRITDQGPAGVTDVVAYFDTISTGAWEIRFNMYVGSGDGAYYNIQQNHDLTAANNLWGERFTFRIMAQPRCSIALVR